MRFVPAALAILAVGVAPSISFPTQVVGGPQARYLTAEDGIIDLNTRNFVPVLELQRRKKDKDSKSATTASATAVASATAAPSAAPATNATTATPATAATAGQVIKIGEENSAKIKTNGFFGSPNGVQGGFIFTKLNMPANAVGNLEVEYNGTAPNTVVVAPKMAAIAPPAGMEYVDPLTFLVSTATPPATGDTYKMDYIFTEAVKSAVDPSKVTIGKLDAATNQFVTEGLGTFKFEEDENEWSLEVADLNGEWGIFAPQTAVLPAKAED